MGVATGSGRSRSERAAADRVDPRADGRRVLVSLQYLRAIAACSVVVHHGLEQFGFQISPAFMQSGVDLFFLISGFLMISITYGQPAHPGGFMLNRAVRICPTYWVFTIATVVLALTVPRLFHEVSVAPGHVVQSLLFWPHLNPAVPTYSPLVRIGWTLNYEMAFYAVFALTMLLREERRLAALTTGFGALVLVGQTVPDLPGALFFYSRPMILEFLAGCWLGWAYVSGRLTALPVVPVAVAAVCSLGLLPLSGPPITDFSRLWAFGGCAALLLTASVLLEERGWLPVLPWLRRVGDWSYSIYLTHVFGIAVLRALWLRAGLPTSGVVGAVGFVVPSVGLALLSGWLSFRLIERPSLRYGRLLLGRGPKPTSRAAPVVAAEPRPTSG